MFSQTAANSGISTGGQTTDNLATGFLKTIGDSMSGPIAYSPLVTSGALVPNVANDNTLDVSQATGQFTSFIIWGAGGSDQMDIIKGQSDGGGAQFFGQILIIESIETLTQTITDESNVVGPPAGNIKTFDGNDFVLGPRKTLVQFVFSSDGFWHQITDATAAISSIVPAGTLNNDHLEWDGNTLEWLAKQKLSFGVTGFALTADLNFRNNVNSFAWKNFLGTGEISQKVTTGDLLQILNDDPLGADDELKFTANADSIYGFTLNLLFSSVSGGFVFKWSV